MSQKDTELRFHGNYLKGENMGMADDLSRVEEDKKIVEKNEAKWWKRKCGTSV